METKTLEELKEDGALQSIMNEAHARMMRTGKLSEEQTRFIGEMEGKINERTNKILFCALFGYPIAVPVRKREKLGSGGQHRVSREEENYTGLSMAVRESHENEFNSALENDEERVFQRARKRLTTIPFHPNVATFWGEVNDENEQKFNISELAGTGLCDYVHQNLITLEDALKLMSGIVSGIRHLHDHGLIHRDIKPSNVCVMGKHPRIIDFNLTRTFEDYIRDIKLGGKPFGSPIYIPGEYLLSRIPSDIEGDPVEENRFALAFDMYALGLTFYYILTGNTPDIFLKNPFGMMHIKAQNMSLKLEYPSSVPSWIQSLVTRMCDPDWRKRPFSWDVSMLLDTILEKGLLAELRGCSPGRLMNLIDEISEPGEDDELGIRQFVRPALAEIQEVLGSLPRRTIPSGEKEETVFLPSHEEPLDGDEDFGAGNVMVGNFIRKSGNIGRYLTTKGTLTSLVEFESMLRKKYIGIPEIFSNEDEAMRFKEEREQFISRLNEVRVKYTKLFPGLFEVIFEADERKGEYRVWVLREKIEKKATLRESLEASFDLNLFSRLDILITIAQSLSALEEAGYVHTHLSEDSVFIVFPSPQEEDTVRIEGAPIAESAIETKYGLRIEGADPGEYIIPLPDETGRMVFTRVEVVETNKVKERNGDGDDPAVTPFLSLMKKLFGIDESIIRGDMLKTLQAAYDIIETTPMTWERRIAVIQNIKKVLLEEKQKEDTETSVHE